MPTVEVCKQQPLLKNRNFLLLWIGQIVSQLGDAVFKFGLVIWIVHTADALTLAGIMTAASIPGIILGPVAGTVVDRLDRKTIIVMCDLIRGAMVLLAGTLMLGEDLTVAHLYALLVVFGIVQPLFSSAVSSTVPNIVSREDLSRVNSLRQLGTSGTSLVGPAIAGVLLTMLGGSQAVSLVFMVNGTSYILSGISEVFLRLPPVSINDADTGEPTQAFFDQVKQGLRYVWDSSLLCRMLPILAIMNFFSVPLNQIVLPVVVIDQLALGEIWLGLIQSGLAAGLLLASLVLSALNWTDHGKPLLMSLFGHGCSILLLGATMGLALYLSTPRLVVPVMLILLALLAGVTGAIANISLTTIAQKIVPDEKRGRVFAFMNTLLGGAAPVALGITGLWTTVAPLFAWPMIGGGTILVGARALDRVSELQEH